MRRFLLLLAALVGAAILAVLALPWWLGTAIRLAGDGRGVSVERYERIGYGTFVLHNAQIQRPGVTVTLSRVEASTPLVFLWRRWRGAADDLRVERWAVQVERRSTPAESAPRTETGWVWLRPKIVNIAEQLDRWVHHAEAKEGSVRWPTGELTFGPATWGDRQVTVKAFSYRALSLDLAARFSPNGERIDVVARQQSEGAVATLANEGATVRGEITWFDQRAPVMARFGDRGWLPAEASVQLENWSIPGERVRLKDAYATVQASAKLDWDGATFGADVHARGEPLDGRNIPPLAIDVQGRGTPQQFTLRALDASVPGIRTHLTAPVTIDRKGVLQDGAAAQFTLEADLAKQPWFEAKGVVNGNATVVSAEGEAPAVNFQLGGADVAARGVALSKVQAEGRLRWPAIEVTQAVLTGGDGERLELRGGWDIRQKQVLDANVSGVLRRESLARWLPAEPKFDRITLRASAKGAVADLDHRGEAAVEDLRIATVKPVTARVEWRGRGASAENVTVDAQAGETRLRAAGNANRDGLQLSQLSLARGEAVMLSLAEPAAVRWKPSLALEALHLDGPDGRVDAALAWGESGRMEASVRNFPSAWLADFVPLKGPAWKVDLLAFTGNWDRSPMTYALTIGATVDLGEGRSAAVMTSARGDKAGLRIEALRATEGNETVLNAVGALPLTLQPGTKPIVKLDEAGALVLDATAAPHSAFWPKLASATGIELKDPQAELHIKGTWARPEGSVQLKAARVAVDPQRLKREIPAVEALSVKLDANRTSIDLAQFSVLVQGQPVRVTGRLPVPEGGWSDMVKEPKQVLERDADLHLEVPDAEVAVFTRFLPAVLAPKGRFAVDARFRNGGISGVARLRDAASRPLGPLGVLQEINAEVQMSGRTITLRSLAAKAGGQPVGLTGAVEIPPGGAPRYDLALRGENLPFVRQTGLLLRGDLDLKLQTPAEGPPRITGHVRLRDSLFLQDVRAFLPRAGAGPTRRPPYFSVDTPPLNTWGLAVEVTGEEFMRLRTPVFNGVASAHLRLGGTLGEPRALGEVTINRGAVRMPFASFDVKQGSVRLTEADPDQPGIYLRGTARRYGYDLTMEIEGTASSPNVEFTSSPALESEQVLLMVMTGAPPSNEITYSGTRRAAQIGAYLGQSLLGSLGGDSSNADRLTITSGEKISRQGKETYDIEYKLSDRWTATGEYNEYDEYNAGLKWRVLPRANKREKPEEPAPAQQER